MNPQNAAVVLEELRVSISERVRAFSLTGNPDTVLGDAARDEAGSGIWPKSIPARRRMFGLRSAGCTGPGMKH